MASAKCTIPIRVMLSFRQNFESTRVKCFGHPHHGRQSMSSQATSKPWYHDNPSTIVSGVTSEDLDNDPNLAEFFASNFPKPPFYLEESYKKDEQLSLDNKKVEKNQDSSLLRLNIRSLKCYGRDRNAEMGSGVCRKMREFDKLIPGLIFGSDNTLGISILNGSESRIWIKTPRNEIQRERDRYNHDFESRVYELAVVDPSSEEPISTHRVVPIVNMHPVLNKPYCVNYLRYYPGRVLDVPIKYINEEESPILKRGGFIVPINKTVKCIVEDEVPIPDYIELDCTGVILKEKLRMDRLIFPDGVSPSKKNPKDFLAGPVFGRGIKDD